MINYHNGIGYDRITRNTIIKWFHTCRQMKKISVVNDSQINGANNRFASCNNSDINRKLDRIFIHDRDPFRMRVIEPCISV